MKEKPIGTQAQQQEEGGGSGEGTQKAQKQEQKQEGSERKAESDEAQKKQDSATVEKQDGEEPSDSEEAARSFDGIVPDEWEMLELPEDHPFRDRGITHWPIPPGFENETRAAIKNSHIRARDVTEANKTASRFKKELIREQQKKKAEVGHWIQKAMYLASDPTVAVEVAKLRRDGNDDVAEAYIERIMRSDMEDLQKQIQEVNQQVERSEMVDTGLRFRQRVLDVIPEQMGITEEQTRAILRDYGVLFDAGRFGEMPHGDTFIPFAQQWLEQNDPSFREQKESEREERIRQKILQELQEKEQERTQRIAQNPSGNLLTESRAGTSLSGGTSSQTAKTTNIREARNSIRNGRVIGLSE